MSIPTGSGADYILHDYGTTNDASSIPAEL